MRQINQLGLDLLKRFEGFELTSYQDSRGFWTIGIGHKGPDVGPGMTITIERALYLLNSDLQHTYRIEGFIQRTLNDNQYSSCVCLAFNIGTNAFKDSTLLKKINTGIDPSDEFIRWNKTTLHTPDGEIRVVESLGLTRRRQAERELFNTPSAITA